MKLSPLEFAYWCAAQTEDWNRQDLELADALSTSIEPVDTIGMHRRITQTRNQIVLDKAREMGMVTT